MPWNRSDHNGRYNELVDSRQPAPFSEGVGTIGSRPARPSDLRSTIVYYTFRPTSGARRMLRRTAYESVTFSGIQPVHPVARDDFVNSIEEVLQATQRSTRSRKGCGITYQEAEDEIRGIECDMSGSGSFRAIELNNATFNDVKRVRKEMDKTNSEGYATNGVLVVGTNETPRHWNDCSVTIHDVRVYVRPRIPPATYERTREVLDSCANDVKQLSGSTRPTYGSSQAIVQSRSNARSDLSTVLVRTETLDAVPSFQPCEYSTEERDGQEEGGQEGTEEHGPVSQYTGCFVDFENRGANSHSTWVGGTTDEDTSWYA